MTISPYTLKNSHILIVDDEEDIAISLHDRLTLHGFTVSVLDNGSEVIGFLEEAPHSTAGAVDLILLDMNLLDLSGRDVLRNLRSHPDPALSFTRVMMLTASIDQQAKVDMLNAGADDYVTKPYSPQELVARVNTTLRTQQLEKQLQQQGQRLSQLNELGNQINATPHTNSVFTHAVEGVLELLNTRAAALFIRLRNQDVMQCRRFKGANILASRYPLIPLGNSIIAATAEEKRPFLVNLPEETPLFNPNFDVPPGMETSAMMSVPVVLRGRPLGSLVAFNPLDKPFSNFELDLLISFAGAIGSALDNAWMFERLQLHQRDLIDSRNALQAIIDGILHPIYTIDEEWKLVSVNQTKADEVGQPFEALQGQVCYEVFFDRESPCEHCQVAEVMAGRRETAWDARWLGSDHVPREWEVNAYPMPGHQERTAKAVVVWDDRTEERRLEQSLLQAGKLAAIGQLAAGVAHEINNPLTAINANAEMLKMIVAEEAETFEYIEDIELAGRRAATVVQGLLDFAREQQYTFEPIDINRTLEKALDLTKYQLHAINAVVDANFAPQLPPVAASVEHIKSVWINLIVNARDAMRDARVDTPRIELTTRYDVDEERVQILVRDNGPGIPEEKVAHIFEPFYTTKDPGMGTGLGLATCHRIVEQHGGAIEVVSEPAVGTTFIVRLPRHAVESQPQVELSAEFSIDGVDA